jgi:hypothetical protein
MPKQNQPETLRGREVWLARANSMRSNRWHLAKFSIGFGYFGTGLLAYLPAGLLACLALARGA